MYRKTIILALICLFPFSSYSEIYKWVDEQGTTHYGDRPESDQSATQLNIPEPEIKKKSSDSESRDERRRRIADMMQEDRIKKEAEDAKARSGIEEKNKQCIYARDRLRQLEDAGYLYNLDKEGNRVILSDEQRKASIEKYQEQIKKHCGN